MAKRMSLLAVVVVLLVSAAVASADPRPPPVSNCQTHVHTDRIWVDYTGARSTDCATVVHTVNRYLTTAHCLTNMYCALGHLDWSCKTTLFDYHDGGPIAHHGTCTK